jgi:hypothetical protein
MASTKKIHNGIQFLMNDPGGAGAQSWVGEEFVEELKAQGYTLAGPGVSAPDFGDLSGKNKAALVSIGEELGLGVSMRMTKDALIIAIEGGSGGAL